MTTHVNSYDADAIRPTVGSQWVWRSDLVTVIEVRWNGEEWWVRTKLTRDHGWPSHDSRRWNDLGVFWENCHYIREQPGPPGHKGPTRKGPAHPDESPVANAR